MHVLYSRVEIILGAGIHTQRRPSMQGHWNYTRTLKLCTEEIFCLPFDSSFLLWFLHFVGIYWNLKRIKNMIWKYWEIDTSEKFFWMLDLFHFNIVSINKSNLKISTDWERRIKTLIRNLLLLKKPQFCNKSILQIEVLILLSQSVGTLWHRYFRSLDPSSLTKIMSYIVIGQK